MRLLTQARPAGASTWVNRYRRHDEPGLLDRSSTPHRRPTATGADLVTKIEALRREPRNGRRPDRR
ncbi:leucine zipper domain-containing protein [Streptomyces sp. NPDC058676]